MEILCKKWEINHQMKNGLSSSHYKLLAPTFMEEFLPRENYPWLRAAGHTYPGSKKIIPKTTVKNSVKKLQFVSRNLASTSMQDVKSPKTTFEKKPQITTKLRQPNPPVSQESPEGPLPEWFSPNK